MSNFENIINENKHNINYAKVLYEQGLSRQVSQRNQLSTEINNVKDNIKFTRAKGNKTINYLDLTIQISNNKI